MQKNNIEDILKQLTPDSYRMQLFQSAKNFKMNWVEFGEHLTKVASDKAYAEWGYKSFEDYCREEIRIKKATAVKLTNAYFFVSAEDPDLLKHSGLHQSLELDAVGFLQKARNDENCSPELYSELKASALDKGHSGSTLARKFKKALEEETPPTEDAFQEQNLLLINRLQKRIKPLENIPSKFKEYLEEMADYFGND